MPVDHQHQQYASSVNRWALTRLCVAGTVKDAEEALLPNPDKDANDAKTRYVDYLLRAVFLNVTGRTRDALIGMAFRKPPEIALPTATAYLEDNASGDGLGVTQLAKSTIGSLLDVGRVGLLADYPATDEGQTAIQTNGLQASIKTYAAESIINWKTEVIGGQLVLSMVVLRESYEDVVDEFTSNTKYQYRVLKLTEGIYTQEVWRDNNIFTELFDVRAGSSTLDFIPFIAIGTYSNDINVDPAALYPLSEVNIAHYRNSADYEESSFLVGQPQPVITGVNKTWVETTGSLKYGSRNAWSLPIGATAQMLQVQPNIMPMEAMLHKEKLMVSIGARLIEPNSQAETAEAARIKHAGDNSVLSNITQNASDGIVKAIEWCGLFMGASGTVTFTINQDFYDKTRSAQDVMADVQLLDRGVLAVNDLRDNLRKEGRIAEERTNEMINAEAEDVSPLL